MRSSNLLTPFLLCSIVAVTAQATEPALSPVTVAADGKISIDAINEPIGPLLQTFAREARLDVALSAAQDKLERKVTVKVSGKSAEEVAELLSDLADLDVEVDEGFLVVTEERGKKRRGRHKIDIGVEVDNDDGSRVVTGGPVLVRAGEEVEDAVAVGGPVRVEGHVRGDAVAIGGGVILAPGAVVEGDAVAIGGQVEVQPGATLRGTQTSLAGSIGSLLRWVIDHDGEAATTMADSFGFSLLATLMRALALFAFGVLLVVFAPGRVAAVATALGQKPFLSFLLGVATLVGLIPACVLLAITVIGIPLIPVVAACFVALILVGATVLATRIGQLLPAGAGRGMLANLALGTLLCALVDLIPIGGTALLFFAALAAGGAALWSRFGTQLEVAPQ